MCLWIFKKSRLQKRSFPQLIWKALLYLFFTTFKCDWQVVVTRDFFHSPHHFISFIQGIHSFNIISISPFSASVFHYLSKKFTGASCKVVIMHIKLVYIQIHFWIYLILCLSIVWDYVKLSSKHLPSNYEPKLLTFEQTYIYINFQKHVLSKHRTSINKSLIDYVHEYQYIMLLLVALSFFFMFPNLTFNIKTKIFALLNKCTQVICNKEVVTKEEKLSCWVKH